MATHRVAVLARLLLFVLVFVSSGCRQVAPYGNGGPDQSLKDLHTSEASAPDVGWDGSADGAPHVSDGLPLPSDGPPSDGPSCTTDKTCPLRLCATAACIASKCQYTATPGKLCGSPPGPCELQAVCDGVSLDCPAPRKKPIEVWDLMATTTNTVWRDSSNAAGLDPSQLAVSCQSDIESRSLLSFPTSTLPSGIEVENVTLALCVGSVIGSSGSYEVWRGSFPEAPTTLNFDTGWDTLAQATPLPTSKGPTGLGGLKSALAAAGQDTRIGLRLPSCSPGDNGAVFASNNSASLPSCATPRLTVRFCRASAGDGACLDASDCNDPNLPCATPRCMADRCEYLPGKAGTICRPGQDCDLAEACDGLRPACPPNWVLPTKQQTFTSGSFVTIISPISMANTVSTTEVEAGCDSQTEKRGVTVFSGTTALMGKKIVSAELDVCLELGSALVGVWTYPKNNITPQDFAAALGPKVGTTGTALIGQVETITLDPTQFVPNGSWTGFMFKLASACSTTWQGRRYGWKEGSCLGKKPALTVTYCE